MLITLAELVTKDQHTIITININNKHNIIALITFFGFIYDLNADGGEWFMIKKGE